MPLSSSSITQEEEEEGETSPLLLLAMSSDPKKKGLLDPKTMDGPVVPVTVHDLLRPFPYLFLTYHVATTGSFLLNTVGVVVGTGLYGCGVRHLPWIASAAAPSSWAALSGTTGLALGGVGVVAGLAALAGIAAKGENASPIPFTSDGVQQRADGLKHNFMVRLVDLSCWTGMGLAATAVLVAGGPAKLKLSAGALGVMQALSLGSALGGLGAFGCLYSLRLKTIRELEADDE
jgi:hypothetical protein